VKAGRRVVIRAAVVGVGLAGLALTVPTFAASKEKPADKQAKQQKCCLVELRGPARTVAAGGAPARFDLLVSRSDKGCTQTRRTITVRLDGLAAEHVRMERLVSGQAVALRDTSAGAGTVEAVDPFIDSKLICGADTEAVASYRIAFRDGTPLGRAELVVAAHAASGKLLDNAATTTEVVDAVRTSEPPPQTTPPAPPVTESPAAEETAAAPPVREEEPTPPVTDAAPPAAAARPPLEPAAETSALSTTLLTSSLVLALAGMLLVGVLWRLRRSSPSPAADEAPTVTLPPGVGAELAQLTEDRDATGPARPAAP
jgi:hypothetical protein